MRTTPARDELREVMDIRIASDYLGISPDTLYKYASDGFVPAFKLGNRWRFKRSRLDEWMDQQSSQGAQPRNTESHPDVAERRKPQSVVPRQKRAVAAVR
jgi:excisionase family DNA binding protein